MRRRIIYSLLLLSLLPFLGGWMKYGYLSYPLKGNISPKEGSIEMWVKPEIDPQEPLKRWYSFYFFVVYPSPGKRAPTFFAFWKPGEGPRMGGTYMREGKQIHLRNTPATWPDKIVWEKDTWHYFAFTWKGKEMALYADGKLIRKTLASHELEIDPGGFIRIGGSHISPFVVDEISISSRARTEEEIRERMKGELKVDEYTLVLDHCEELIPTDTPSKKETRAEMISGFQGEKGGVGNFIFIPQGYKGRVPEDEVLELTQGKFGKGIRLKVVEGK